ncbi:peroxisomal assembly protein [Steccherinum ochraceum]|uniref:Peroxisomal ATPase PEX6 n=1 Tax=Steccherinum ochraceum TaxID=92696 RepID=A0A4R0RJH5_9APHY|nr:peroxisomal assembly protein [Steccherinum ochraceum]
MTYLFDSPAVVDVAASLGQSATDDDVLVAQKVWDYLVDGSSVAPARTLLSISRLQPLQSLEDDEIISESTLIAWCRPASSISGIVVPPSWLSLHPKTIQSGDISSSSHDKTHRVSFVQPAPLTQMVLLAHSREGYNAAQARSSEFNEWLAHAHPFIAQGNILQAPTSIFEASSNDAGPSHAKCFGFKVVETEPVAHGLVQREQTRILLFTAPDDDMQQDAETEEDWTEVDDALEIDERFLGSSILYSIPPSSSQTNGAPKINGDNHLSPNGHVDTRHQTSQEWQSSVEPLSRPFSSHDDEAIYLQTRDLSRIGVLNGDWAVVRPVGQSCSRLVRVIASDELVPQGQVLVSPTFLHNITKGVFNPPVSSTSRLAFRSSPFGSKKPTLPTAQRITVARIASAASVDRANESAFLRALRTYFHSSTRLVKEGDIIALPIDTNEKHSVSSGEAEEEESVPIKLPGIIGSSNEVVYFSVTNIEHDVLPVSGEILSTDTYVGSTVGELGCWVDSTITRIVQTGVEHSFIPRCAGYLGVFPSDTRLKANKAFQALFSLCSAAISKDAAKYQLQLSVLLQGTRGVGKTTVAMSVAHSLGINHLEVNCFDILGESAVQSEAMLQVAFEKASSCSPCMLVLKHVDALGQATQNADPSKGLAIADVLGQCIADTQQAWASTGFPVLVLATTATPEQVPTQVSSLFKHQISMETPEDSERLDILEGLLEETAINPDVSVKELATETAAFVSRDLFDLTLRAKNSSVKHIMTDIASKTASLSGIQLKAKDIDSALSKARENHAESIGAPQIPQVSWDDVGGIADAKADILDTIQLPLEHPELFAVGMKKRSGILLYGPPGTGKTLLAKAVATSCALNFFSVKGPELLNMYIGESEANVRRIFQKAKDARPCVIFFDELDSIAPKRGNHGDSGGVMDRIVSQLLAELDGVSAGNSGADIFVIGATNRPDLLDPALLRPGRFDRMLYLGVSTTNEAQLNILHALTRKFKLHPDLDLNNIVEACPFHFTGADFYALCADSLLRAMSRKAEQVDEKIALLNANPPPHSNHPYPLTPQYYLAEMAEPSDIEVLVSHEDFKVSLDNLVPSVTPEEMAHYSDVQKQFSKNNLVN